jgi:hypothetical protein
MNWHALHISKCATHHVDAQQSPAYHERFDEVLKFHEPGLAPVRLRQKAWHIRPDGSPAYRQCFLETFGFYDGLAAVAAHDGWHHVTAAGGDAYLDRYGWCGNFQQALCTVRDRDGKYRHIRYDGSAAYPERWHYAGDYRDGVAVVQASDGRSTHIDHEGKLLHDEWFLDLDVFHKGFARARAEDGWRHVDGQGRSIYQRRFAAVEPFYNGQARVERFDGALEVIDCDGVTLIELRPSANRLPLAAAVSSSKC